MQKNRKFIIKKALNALNDKEKHILMKRHLTEEPKTLESVGKELLISKERVRQLETRAMLKLKKRLLLENSRHDLL